MLAYAASRPVPVERRPYPNAMLAIVALHVAALAALMSAKMDIPLIIRTTPIDTFNVPKPKDPPPPVDPVRTPNPTPLSPSYSNPEPVQPMPLPQDPAVPSGLTLDPGPPAGELAYYIPPYRPPVHHVVKLGPTLLTSGDALKPPYPASKIVTEEEASLTLRLTIDARGRVVAVEPVGRTDRVFLEAARRHLIGHWRYRPASEDGRSMASSAVITLRFQLDG